MVRSAKWMSSAAVGLVLAWEGLPANAQTLAIPAQSRSAREAQADDSQAASYEDSTGTDKDDRELSARDTEISRPKVLDESDESTSVNPSETEVVTERYPDGAVKIEREVTQDAQFNYINHGAWEMWDQAGNPVAQGEYENNNRTGTWIRWYRTLADGSLLTKAPYQQFATPFISQATFSNGRLDGAWTIYDGKKRKISQWEFVDGKRHGKAIWWHANGRKMREVSYRDGEIDGELVEWGPEGSVLVKDTYQFGRKVASKTANHPGGKKKSEGVYLFAKDVEQTPDDWWNCKPQVTIKQGKDERHGPWTSWYSNGQRQMEGTFEHDVQVGQFTWWHNNGQKSLEGRFETGKQDGPWTWWYASGQRSIRGEYVHGNPTGRWTWWKEDGKVAQSADLSHSEGVVIETPHTPDLNSPPQAIKHPEPPRSRR
jgi:antitoxin component YwqK of YwqJK toxin-antitoxin module